RLTYRALHADSVRLAQGLLALGLGPGDHVAVWLPNRPEWLVVQHACARIGAVVVALNTRYRTHELDYILRQSDAAALVLADHSGPVDFLEVLAGVLPGLATADPDRLAFPGFAALPRRHGGRARSRARGGGARARRPGPPGRPPRPPLHPGDHLAPQGRDDQP